MRKGKVGLQKEISRIFTGVQIPQKDTPGPDSRSSVPDSVKSAAPKPVGPPPKPFTIPEPSDHPAPATKQAVNEPSAKAPAAASKAASEPAHKPASMPPAAPAPKPVSTPSPGPAPASGPSVRQLRTETVSKQSRRMPLLKIWQQLSAKLLTTKPGVNPGRQKAMILMMPVLAVILVVVLIQVLSVPASSAKFAKKAASTDTAFDGQIDWQRPPVYPATLRDPMKFSTTVTDEKTQENIGRPVVKGIVYSEDSPCAVVGERIVSVGDVVEGATVVKINANSVEFTMDGKTWTQEVER